MELLRLERGVREGKERDREYRLILDSGGGRTFLRSESSSSASQIVLSMGFLCSTCREEHLYFLLIFS